MPPTPKYRNVTPVPVDLASGRQVLTGVDVELPTREDGSLDPHDDAHVTARRLRPLAPTAGRYDQLLAGPVGNVVSYLEANPAEVAAVVAAEDDRAGDKARKGITDMANPTPTPTPSTPAPSNGEESTR